MYYHADKGGVVHAGIVWDDAAAAHLQTLFPALLRVRVNCPVFQKGGVRICPHRGRLCLQDILAHLNDFHYWPRTEKDRTEKNQHLPTILGWLREEAAKNGWDLTARVPT